jgi:hypothetical protein
VVARFSVNCSNGPQLLVELTFAIFVAAGGVA